MKPKITKWLSIKKAEIVLSSIKGVRKMVDICGKNDLKQSEVEEMYS